MNKTVTLDEEHFNAAEQRARELGTTPEAYIHKLIDEASKTFDQILEPVRKGFEPMSDEELDDLFDRAITATRKSN